MENVVTLIETISGFIWGGTWGDRRVLRGGRRDEMPNDN